ncbi:MAG: response regulator [Clostridiales bacterium]|nr:response regulator [Clostridiales bacterium]
MDTQDKNKRRIRRLRYLFILCTVVLAGVMVLSTQTVVNQGMRNHQLQMVEMVSGRITENMNHYFQGQWDNIQYVRNTLKQGTFRNETEILECLGQEEASISGSYNELLLLLVDEEGFYYSADAGKVAFWRSPNTAFASTELDREKSVSISSLAELSSESKEYLCFTKKLEDPITAEDGSKFTHMVLATDKSIFDIDLSLASFGTITDVFVMNSQGKTINAQELQTDLAKTYNLVKTLERANFSIGNSYEELKEALTIHSSATSMIGFEDNKYYISFQYMGIEDWYAVFLIDQHDMHSSVTQIMYQMGVRLTLGFVLMGIALVAFLLGSTRIHLMEERRNKEQLRIAMEAANQANRAKSEFLSRMSHDIRTPLGGIMGMTDMAEAKADDKEALRECLRKIRSASKHLETLVNEVLDISRIESGNVMVKESRINLYESMTVVHDIIESRALSRNQIYETDFTGIIHPYVFTDDNLLIQIMLNLLGNSVKYTPESGRIKFTVFEQAVNEQSSEYHFIVEDNGIGMKPEFLEHIFERFSQEAISARSSYEGTGLGMAIVKEFVDLLDGAITIESEVNVGTKFEVIFSFALAGEGRTEETDVKESIGKKKEYHILLAEDNDINREIVQFILTENGMTCAAVENGQKLVDVFSSSALYEFDAILTDIRMPVLDGLDAVKAIRALEREDAGSIPIIAITANAYDDDKALSRNAGFNAHLAKPLDQEQMMKTLNQLCECKGK